MIGMLGLMKVFSGVLVLRRVATTYVTADQALPQMDPGVAHLQTFFATLATRFYLSYFSQVAATSFLTRHVLSFCDNAIRFHRLLCKARRQEMIARQLWLYASRNLSASNAAMQPVPAAVIAWR